MIGLVNLSTTKPGPVFLVEWEEEGDETNVLGIYCFRPKNLNYFALDGLNYEKYTLAPVDADWLSYRCEVVIERKVRNGNYIELEGETLEGKMEMEMRRVSKKE